MQEIKNNSIILAPSVLHAAIRKELLQKKRGWIGITLQTIENYFLSLTSHPDSFDDIIFQYYQKLKTLQPSLHIYRNICLQDHFLHACMQFIDDMKTYAVLPGALPQDNAEEKELTAIINALYEIPTRMQYIMEAAHMLPRSDKQIYIYPAIYTHQQAMLCEKLKEQGAVLWKQNDHEPIVSFYHAINMREEVEGMAQYIIHQNIDAQDISILCCHHRYHDLIRQIFTHYHIPFTLTSHTIKNLPALRFHTILTYYLQPDEEHFSALLETGIFDTDIPIYEYKEYRRLFQKTYDEDVTEIPSVNTTLLSSYEIEKLQQLCEKAKQAQDRIRKIIRPLSAMSWKDALIEISAMTAQQLPAIHHRSFLQLQAYIRHAVPYIKEKEDLSILCSCIQKLPSAKPQAALSGAVVYDQSILPVEHTYSFILGACQSDYPAFPLKNGIFDEAYYAKTPLPSMQERYDHFLCEKQKQLSNSKHLIISYPLGDYEGKGKEAALEIETFTAKPSSPWLVRYQYLSHEAYKQLPPEQAHALYAGKGLLHGSISSLERYRRCPFSYYLRYGLHVKEPFSFSFDASRIGTLSHHILEVLTKTYGKEYANASKQIIEQLLEQELNPLADLFKNHADWIDLLKQRLLTSIQQNLKILSDMEAHSGMSVFQSEYEFSSDYPLDNAILRLHGFIDRIDCKNEYIRILDYKSSPKSLQEAQVFAALQLQLITYGIISSQTFRKTLLGTYYVSLKNENIPCIAGKMKRRPATYIPLQKEDHEAAFYTAHRMQGWHMDEHADIMDDNGTHIIGLSMNRNNEIKARKQYDIHVLAEHFQTMYQTIGSMILNGDISIAPDDSACQYCKYHDICRFKGFPAKKEALVEPDDSIYKP